MANSDKNKKRKKLKKQLKQLKKEKYTTSKWSVKKPLYIDKSDKRYKRHEEHLKEFGFSKTETWSLYSVIAEFILPRLKSFRDVTIAHPIDKTEKEWSGVLDKMIFAFEWSLEYDKCNVLDMKEEKLKENWERHEEGMELFRERFMDLWW